MSRPYTLPVGPTRRAESSTSMPPPEPRSRTVSPALSLAKAVGLPQPSEATTASSGICPVWLASYKLEVIGSLQPSRRVLAPQHELPPVVTRSAAWPYFSLTISLISIGLLYSCSLVRTRRTSAERASRSRSAPSACSEKQHFWPDHR